MEIVLVNALSLPSFALLHGTRASFHPLESTVAIACDREIFEFDLTTGARLSSIRTSISTDHLSHVETNNALVAASSDGSIHAWNLNEHKLHVSRIPTKSREQHRIVSCAMAYAEPMVFFSKEGARHIGVMHIYGEEADLPILEGHSKQVSAIGVDPRKDHVVSGSIDGQLRIHDASTRQVVADLSDTLRNVCGRAAVSAICFDARGDTIALGTADGHFVLFDAMSGAVPVLKGSRRVSSFAVCSIQYHAYLGFFFVLTADGSLSAYFLKRGLVSADAIGEYGAFRTCNIFSHDRSVRLVDPSRFGFLLHPRANYAIFTGVITPSNGASSQPCLPVYSLCDSRDPMSLLPCVVRSDIDPVLFLEVPFSVDGVCAQSTSQSTSIAVSESGDGVASSSGSQSLSSTEDTTNTLSVPTFFFPRDVLFTDVKYGNYVLNSHVFSHSSSHSSANPRHGNTHPKDHQHVVSAKVEHISGLITRSEDISDGDLYRPVRIVRGSRSKHEHFLVFFTGLGTIRGRAILNQFSICKHASDTAASPLQQGRDGAFVGVEEVDFVVVSNDGKSVIVDSLNPHRISQALLVSLVPSSITGQADERDVRFDGVDRVWSAPYGADENGCVIYYERGAHRLLYSRSFSEKNLLPSERFTIAFPSDTTLSTPAFDSGIPFGCLIPEFSLWEDETLIDVAIVRQDLSCTHPPSNMEDASRVLSPDRYFVGVLTSQRALILNPSTLRIHASYENKTRYPHRSCLWCGLTFLFNTDIEVRCLSSDGTSSLLCSIDTPNSVLCAAFQDRLVFATFLKEKTFMWHRGIGLLEPIILGLLGARDTLLLDSSFPSTVEKNMIIQRTLDILSSVVSRYECHRISPALIQRLQEKPPRLQFTPSVPLYPFASLAFELVQHLPQRFNWEVRFRAAVRACRFPEAFEVLSQQKLKLMRKTAHLAPGSRLYDCFAELGSVSIQYGKFFTASRCFEEIGDEWTLFSVFSASHNEQGIRLLSQRLDKSSLILPDSSDLPESEKGSRIRPVGHDTLWSRFSLHTLLRQASLTKREKVPSDSNSGVEQSVEPIDDLGLIEWPCTFFENEVSSSHLLPPYSSGDASSDSTAKRSQEGTWPISDRTVGDMLIASCEDGVHLRIHNLTNRSLFDWLGSPKTMIHVRAQGARAAVAGKASLDVDQAASSTEDKGSASSISKDKAGSKDSSAQGTAASRSFFDEDDDWSDDDGDSKKPKLMIVINTRQAAEQTSAGAKLSSISNRFKAKLRKVDHFAAAREVEIQHRKDDAHPSPSERQQVSVDPSSSRSLDGPKQMADPTQTSTILSSSSSPSSSQSSASRGENPMPVSLSGHEKESDSLPPQNRSSSDPEQSASASQHSSVDFDDELDSDASSSRPKRSSVKLGGGGLSLRNKRKEQPKLDFSLKGQELDAAVSLFSANKWEESLDACRTLLIGVEPTSADASEFIDRCCGYIRLAHLLLSQRSIAADQPAVSAYIFAHASYLPHLVSGHRVRVSRLAISHSISGGLYALAHSLIQELLPQAPPQARPQLEQQLSVCEEHENRNEPLSSISVSSNLDPKDLVICMKTFVPLNGEERLKKCVLCKSAFHITDAGIRSASKCPVCGVGIVSEKKL